MLNSFKKLFRKVDKAKKYEPLKDFIIDVYEDVKAQQKIIDSYDPNVVDMMEEYRILERERLEEVDELKDEIKNWEEDWDKRPTDAVEILKEESYDPNLPVTLYDEQKSELLSKMFKHLSLKDLEKIEVEYSIKDLI